MDEVHGVVSWQKNEAPAAGLELGRGLPALEAGG
jgi:hypothetical protein